MTGYALADAYLSGSGVVDVPRRRAGDRGRGGDDFTPTVTWIGRIADAVGGHRELRQKLRIDVQQDPDDNNFIAFCSFATCSAVGDTPDEAKFELGLEILRVRDDLAATDDGVLAQDAIDVKNRLLRAIP